MLASRVMNSSHPERHRAADGAEVLGSTLTPDGRELILHRRGDHLQIRCGGLELMSNHAHGSEEALAAEVLPLLATKAPRVLIGGLGMGYTLRAALDTVGPDAELHVCEVFEAVVEWNRGPLSHVAGHPLRDSRVTVLVDDVARVIETSPATYDALLLDVDNGPEGFVLDRNDRIYDEAGVERCRRALRPGGILAVWSSSPARHFGERLQDGGFRMEHREVPALGDQGPPHSLYLGFLD